MIHRTCKTLFFAGTDTDVGKTYVSALVARSLHDRGHRVGVYKPVASGCPQVGNELVADDAVHLWTAAGKPRSLEEVCPQKFEAPLAPPVAATAEGRTVDSPKLFGGARDWLDDSEVLIVEGAGGLMSPLADDLLCADLVEQFAPCRLVIVAAQRLGVIHQVVATCEAACYRKIRPFGIVLCCTDPHPDPSAETNLQQISVHCDVPVLGCVTFGATTLEPSIADQLID